MSMNTALSGLNAAQSDIAATSHNIANVGTIGFRASRAEFADVFSQSPQSVSATRVGSGTQVTRIAQDFSQGSVVGTGKTLDIAIEGPGFFALRSGASANGAPGAMMFSRAGAFGMTADGTIVNAANQQLLGWPTAATGAALSLATAAAVPFRVPFSMGVPVATTQITAALRLPTDPAMAGAQSAVPPAAAFDPADPATYAHRSQLPVFDATGLPIETEVYLVRLSNPDAATPETEYAVHLLRNGTPLTPDAGNTITLGADGRVLPGGGTLAFAGLDGALTLDLGASRLEDAPFRVDQVNHDGRNVSQLSALEVDRQGTVWATYGAEERVAQGRFMLVNFANPGGLRIMGNAAFTATGDSGEPIAGVPGSAGFGQLRSGALEKANVDLTEELVDLISAQRNYQANAKALETSATMTQTIMNMRT
jgi:flagellar hook protein FlgE